MAVDVYVMPWWRFFAGEFSSPLERLVPRSKIKVVTTGLFGRTVVRTLRERRPGPVARYLARRQERRLRRWLKLNGVDPSPIATDGEIVYSNLPVQ